MLTNLAADAVETVYPGGSSLDNPVPVDVAYYASPWGYGIFTVVVLMALLLIVTRLNAER